MAGDEPDGTITGEVTVGMSRFCQRSFGLRVVVHLFLLCVLSRSGPARGEEAAPLPLPPAVVEAQRLSTQADALVKQGREQEAAHLYLAAHMNYQATVLDFFETALKASLGNGTASDAVLRRTGQVVADLRNINLTKLWIVVDPDDRAFDKELEDDRADLLRRFDAFTTPLNAGPLEDFLHRLYPEDSHGARQIDALREGHLPASARWARLKRR
jgi:hypothetical protein